MRGVGVGGEDHGAGAVEDAVGREVVQELAEVGLGKFGGCCLGGAKFVEGNKELVVNCATVI